MRVCGERLFPLRDRKRPQDAFARRSLLAVALAALLAACAGAPPKVGGRPFPRSRRGNR